MSNSIKVNPFINTDGEKNTSPIVYLDGRDSQDSGVLLISKEDKQYIRGDRLYVKYKGIGIYSDIDDVISINTYNDEIYVFRHDELTPPEDREYLLLLVFNDEEVPDTFLGISGRQYVFDYLVANAELFDWTESKILAETTKMQDMWTIFRFAKMCINNEMVKNPSGFDPDDYGAYVEEEILELEEKK